MTNTDSSPLAARSSASGLGHGEPAAPLSYLENPAPSLPVAEPFCLLQGELLQRSWWPVVVGLAPGLLGPAFLPFRDLLALGFFLLPVGFVFAAQSWHQKAFPRVRPVSLRFTADRLLIEGEAPIAADAIAEVTTLTRNQRQELLLGLRDGTTRWLRLTTEDAPLLLRTMGLDAGRRRASFALVPPYSWRFLLLFFPLLGLMVLVDQTSVRQTYWLVQSLAPMIFWDLLASLVLAWVLGVLLRGRVTVGADGLLVRWVWRSNFIHFRDMEQIEWGHERVWVQRSGQPRLSLRPRVVTTYDIGDGVETTALYTQIHDALRRWRALDEDFAATDDLGKFRHEGPSAWLRSLDSLTHAPARYRVAAPLVEGLPAVLDNPAVTPEIRVGAAVVLLRRGDEASRAQVRAATDGCASPELRRTLLSLEEAQSDQDFIDALATLDHPTNHDRTAG